MSADHYRLAAQRLGDTRVWAGVISCCANDELPMLPGSRIPAGIVDLAPATITFLVFTAAGNRTRW